MAAKVRVSSRSARLACFSLAILCHGSLALALIERPEPRIEGAVATAQVRLGNAFEDMAAGTLVPVAAETAVQQRDADTTAPQPIRPETAAPAEKAVPPGKARALPADKSAPIRPTAARPADPERQDATPAERAAPVIMARLEAVETEAETPKNALRPKERPPVPDPAPPRKPAKNRAPEPRPEAKAGNAARDARAGEAQGAKGAQAREAGKDGRQQVAGNAAASNYPGLVMRHLSRAGKPRVRARGAAVIGFTIGPAGRLASLSLTRSSGSPDLDRAALAVVRDAGDFPAPPAGARRAFSIRIEGR